MIEDVEGRLKAWVAGVLGDVTMSLEAPGNAATGRGVSLYLLDLAARPPVPGTGRAPLQLTLRYLVTSWADDPTEAHLLLEQLAFAAMDSPDFEVELQPPAPEAWLALGARPRPAFYLRVPLRQPRPEPAVKRVLQPIAVRTAPLISLQGVVLGPGAIPVAGARVELPAFGRSAYTDSHGRFRLTGVPGEPHARVLRVSARGTEQTLTVEGNDPLSINLELRED